MGALRRVQAVLARVCAVGAGLSIAALFLIVFVNSLMRYTIGKSLQWGEELPVYLGIYGMMFGVASAYLQDRNIKFAVLLDLLPVRVRTGVLAVIHVLTIVISGVFVWSAYAFVARRGAVEASGLIGQVRDLARATGQPWLEVFGHMGIWQSATILGGALFAMAAALKLVDTVAALRPRERAP